MSADYPSLDKTWQYNVNQTLAAAGTALACGQLALFSFYASLVGFATNPWQPRGSNNGSTASLLAVSATGPGTGWASASSVNFSLAGQSWAVVRQIGLSSGAHPELLISSSGNSGTAVVVYFSPAAGFTGGTTTTLPTATDQILVTNGGAFGVNGTNRAYNLHALQSSDGACTRVAIVYSSVCTLWFSIENAKTQVTGWTTPVIVSWVGNNTTTNVLTGAGFYNTTAGYTGVTPGTLAGFSLFLTGEFAPTNLLTKLLSVPNDLSTEYPMMPIGLFSYTSPARGRLGMVYDLWWGLSVNTFGQEYAGVAAHAFAQFGEMIVPWNGTAANVT